jgi:hypothetical protein
VSPLASRGSQRLPRGVPMFSQMSGKQPLRTPQLSSLAGALATTQPSRSIDRAIYCCSWSHSSSVSQRWATFLKAFLSPPTRSILMQHSFQKFLLPLKPQIQKYAKAQLEPTGRAFAVAFALARRLSRLIARPWPLHLRHPDPGAPSYAGSEQLFPGRSSSEQASSDSQLNRS